MKHLLILIFALFSATFYGQMPQKLTPADKVYGLSKFWQEVNYNFVYLNKVDREQWESEYKKLITEVQETENDYEYYRLLQKFCAFLKDGHTNIYFPQEIYDKLNDNFEAHKFQLNGIQGKAVITGINKSKKEELPLGTEVTKVNGMPTQDYLDHYVIPFISSSTDYVLQELAVKNMFEGPIGTNYKVEFKLPDNSIKTLDFRISENKLEEEMYPPVVKKELLEFKWITRDDVAYIALNSFDDATIIVLFKNTLPELYKAKKLIIDIRNNGGGNTNNGKEILKYLTNDTLLYGSRSQTRQHISTLKAWGNWTKDSDTLNDAEAKRTWLAFRDELVYAFPYGPDTVKLEQKRIIVPTAILISMNTASAAEDFLIFADNQEHMIKIGGVTFGSTGQPLPFEMPGGGIARICTKKDTYPSGKEFVGLGILPNIEVEKTLKDYLENKDPVLEAALNYLGKEPAKKSL